MKLRVLCGSGFSSWLNNVERLLHGNIPGAGFDIHGDAAAAHFAMQFVLVLRPLHRDRLVYDNRTGTGAGARSKEALDASCRRTSPEPVRRLQPPEGSPSARMSPLPAWASSEPCTPRNSIPPEPVSTRTEPEDICCRTTSPLPVLAFKPAANAGGANVATAGFAAYTAFHLIQSDVAGTGFRVHRVPDARNLQIAGAGLEFRLSLNALHALISGAGVRLQAGCGRGDNVVADGDIVPQGRIVNVADADVVAALLDGRIGGDAADFVFAYRRRTSCWP